MRDWLVQARIQKSLTQKQVAEMSNVSQPTYWNIEQGKKNPTVATAKKIATVLDIPWVRFYESEGESYANDARSRVL